MSGPFVVFGVGPLAHAAAAGDCYHQDMKKNSAPNGRKHGMRAKTSGESRMTTTLTFEPGSQAYHWTTARDRSRPVIKH